MAHADPGSPGAPDQPGGARQGSAPPPPPIFPHIPGYPGPAPFQPPEPPNLPPFPPAGFPGFPGQPPAASPKRGSSAKPWLLAFLIILAATVLFGGLYVVDRAYGPPTLTGTWSVSLTSSTGTQAGTMNLTQIGNQVTGTATLTTSGLPSAETVSGSMLGQSVTLDLIGAGDFLQLNGAFSDATHLSGTFTSLDTAGSAPDSGTWSATKTS